MATIGINTSKAIALSLFLGISLIFGLSSCESRITPNKVERVLTKDTWRISLFLYEGQNIEANYIGTTFDFSDNGVLSIVPFTGVSGNWNAGLGKKPSLLYISGFIDPEYFILNDDWTMTSCSKQTIQLESENGSFVNKLTLMKVED